MEMGREIETREIDSILPSHLYHPISETPFIAFLKIQGFYGRAAHFPQSFDDWKSFQAQTFTQNGVYDEKETRKG